MSLTLYNKKRRFNTTPEPKGKPQKKETTTPLTFVIQRHEASRLHYDFRLEMNGVLKSWAIPKGPSLNPEDKRLAMMVEDHPMEYAHFEGIIPEGNYGAGTVMVWDKGVYHPLAFVNRNTAEELLEEQIEKGDIKFVMLGEKIKGEFALVRIHDKVAMHDSTHENAWLLIKKHDEYVSKKDVLKNNHSVLTGRTMDEIRKEAIVKEEIWYSSTDSKQIPKYGHQTETTPHDTELKKFKNIKPMLAQNIDEPFDSNDWIFEMKYDGYRVIAEVEHGTVHLYSRNGISFDEKFASIAESLKQMPANAVFDGEVIIVDTEGHPHFQWLQDYPSEKKGELRYVLFDLLYYKGRDLTNLPLLHRKELLKEILPPLPYILYSDHIEHSGIEMFHQIQQLGIEGIIGKKKKSIYTQGRRSSDWVKIKTHLRQEVIITGYTAPKGGRNYFGSLIIGVYKGKTLTYIGHVGGGFNEEDLLYVYKRLQPLQQKKCPFNTPPPTNGPAIWVKPTLLAEITFSEWTKDGQVRHPIFLGLREDKYAPTVIRERKHIKPIQHAVSLTNLSKVFWPEEGYTKGDLLTYYQEIAPILLPYLKDRPESLLRYPNGVSGKNFYQKDAHLLDVNWVETVTIHSNSNNKNISYLLCQDKATLLYLINLGCIDLNPWSSRVGHLDNPDYLIIDLDPEQTIFENVVKTALAAREVLDVLEIPSYVKTSGAKGMHIYIPLGAQYTYEQSRHLAELLCIQIHAKTPDITSMKRNPKERRGMVYLDYLQNIQGQTLASVYSVRPQPGATVSTPLQWSEVTKKLHPSQFTMNNIHSRIQKHGDLFKEVLGKGINIAKVLHKLEKYV